MTDDSGVEVLAAAITGAWLANPHTRANADDAAAVLVEVHSALSGAGPAAAASPVEEARAAPAVTIRRSLASPDHIISMVDGKPYRTLKRHLTANGLTPDSYRARYGLPADYPMVAPSYAAARSGISKQVQAARKKAPAAAAPEPVAARSKHGRKTIAEAKAAAKAHLGV